MTARDLKSLRIDWQRGSNMACEIVESAGAFFTVWGRPNKLDFARAIERLRSAAERNGGPVVFVTRVPANAPPPDAQTRKYLNELMPSVVACCSSYHVVLEGSGFASALKRGVLVSLFQLTQRRGMFFVHSTSGDVIRHLPPEQVATVQNMLQRAKERGLLDGNILQSLAPSRRLSFRETGS